MLGLINKKLGVQTRRGDQQERRLDAQSGLMKSLGKSVLAINELNMVTDGRLKSAAEGVDKLRGDVKDEFDSYREEVTAGFENAFQMRSGLFQRQNIARTHREKLEVTLNSMIGKPPPGAG